MKVMEKHASSVSYITGGSLFSWGTVTLNDITMVVGIATGLGTFLVNWYYKRKEDRRLEADRASQG